MNTTDVHRRHVEALAERLITDIQGRGLTVGDRYLTTEEIRRILGVRKAVASKVVRQLAEQEILIPRQRAGTFIGQGFRKQNRSNVRTIYVLLPACDPSATHWAYQPFIAGIRSSVPDVNVQFTFIPEGNPLPYVEELIEDQRATGHFLGVVAVSCPPEVYRFLSERRVPAVVSGSLYSSELQLSSVDLDNYRSGQLMTRYLIDRGHSRMALLSTAAGRPGDNLLLDGVVDTLAAAGLAPNVLIQRAVRNDIMALRATARELLERSDRPTGLMTRGSFQVAAVAEAAADAGLRVPGEVDLVFDHMDETTHSIDTRPYAQAVAALPFVEHAAMIGEMLQEISESIGSQPQRKIIPMEFREPEQA